MKKILLLTIATLALSSLAFAHHEKKFALMKELATELQGKSIMQPAELCNAWKNLHIKKIDLIKREFENMESRVPAKVKPQIEDIIATLDTLSGQLKALPKHTKPMKKTFELLPEWIKLKKEMFVLKGKELAEIAKQTNLPAAKELAKMHHKAKEAFMESMSKDKEVRRPAAMVIEEVEVERA